MIKLHHHIGLELTFHTTKSRTLSSKLNKELFSIYGEEFSPIAHSDCDLTLEIGSIPTTNLDSIHKYYDFISSWAKSHKLPTHPKRWTSGGGHLNLSAEKRMNLSIVILTNITRKFPFLPWIFNEPEDALIKVDFGPRPVYYSNNCFTLQYGDLHHHRLEIRFFEAPMNWLEQRAHILFADRWVALWSKLRDKVLDKVSIQNLSFEDSKQKFLHLLDKLELPHKPYQIFIDRNLRVLFESGWLRYTEYNWEIPCYQSTTTGRSGYGLELDWG